MDFIFNSRQKKVEVIYENQEELDQILDLIKKYGKYKETQLGGFIGYSDYFNIQTNQCSNTHSKDILTITSNNSDEHGYDA